MGVTMNKRVFTSLNHPEPDVDGVQRYSVHEVFSDPVSANGRRYERVADGLTATEVDEYVNANGVYDA